MLPDNQAGIFTLFKFFFITTWQPMNVKFNQPIERSIEKGEKKRKTYRNKVDFNAYFHTPLYNP
jgi:hypothetical protein